MSEGDSYKCRGKRGSLRTIIAFQINDKAFYVYGFAKGKRANIRDDELKVFKLIAEDLLCSDNKALSNMIEAEELVEVGPSSPRRLKKYRTIYRKNMG